MNFIDSHAHINDPAFDADRAQIIQKSFDSGLSHIVEIACEEQEWQPAADLSQKYDGKIYPVCGMHPIYARTFTADNGEKLETFLNNPLVKAVGEIGLDYAYLHESSKEVQQEVFLKMLLAADKYKKPVVLHCRKTNDAGDYAAYDDMVNIFKQKPSVKGGIMHCFSGRYSDAVWALDNGLLIGINGIIGYKKNEDLRRTVKKIGAKYLVVETDCPYLPPQSKRGQRNDPSNIPEIAATTADVLGISLSSFADITTQNTRDLFKF